MNGYEAKRQARIDRLHARADRVGREAAGRIARADSMAKAIPLGQPILVGHHSEGRDRRYRARIEQGFRKGFEQAKEAQELARRATAAEENEAVSSDDPEAVTKLREKIAGLEKLCERAKMINKIVLGAYRRWQKDPDRAAKLWAPDAVAACAAAGIPAGIAKDACEPDECGNFGIPSYWLSNRRAEIRRCEARIAAIETRAVLTAPEPKTIGAVRIEEADNRVRMRFPGKPTEEIRARLKSFGFRWSPTEGAWQRHASRQAWYWAERIAAELLPTAVGDAAEASLVRASAPREE